MSIEFSIRLDGETYKPNIIDLAIVDTKKQLYVMNSVTPKDLFHCESFESVFQVLRGKIDAMEKKVNGLVKQKKELTNG